MGHPVFQLEMCVNTIIMVAEILIILFNVN